MKNKILRLLLICIPIAIGTILPVGTLAQNVGIGTATPAGKVHIKGAADATQLIIDANATQSNTNPLFKLRKSDGTDLMWIHSDNAFNTFTGLYAGSVNNAAGGGLYNTFIGRDAGSSNTTGYSNTANGSLSFQFNTTGFGNTAHGVSTLQSNTLGNYNTAIGGAALANNTTGSENTAIGLKALFLQSYDNGNMQWVSANTAVGYNALFYNQPAGTFNGINNTAVGSNAMYSNTIGAYNTAIGKDALYSNVYGTFNTAIGALALRFNNFGVANTATGHLSLYQNTIGIYNTATGYGALQANTTASQNTAIGFSALNSQSFANGGIEWASANTAVGYKALYLNQPTSTIDGNRNTAVGHSALFANSEGRSNTAIGHAALYANTGGYYNTAVGDSALSKTSGDFADGNTAIGRFALINNVSGERNTSVGYGASNVGPSQDNNTIIGANAYINNNASGSTAIGYGANTNTNNLVVLGFPPIAATGGYAPWSNWSDGRFKRNVSENVKGLGFILHLRPVTYQMDVKGLYDFWGTSPYGTNRMERDNKSIAFIDDAIQKKESIVMTGFIAQEVEKAARDCGYDFDGVIRPQHDKDHYRIAYAEFVVPLVKAVQEQQKMIEDLRKEIDEIKKSIKEKNN